MSGTPLHELRRMGFSDGDIELARATQDAQRRTGAPVQSIGAIVGAVQPRRRPEPTAPVSLTERAMRRRGPRRRARRGCQRR